MENNIEYLLSYGKFKWKYETNLNDDVFIKFFKDAINNSIIINFSSAFFSHRALLLFQEEFTEFFNRGGIFNLIIAENSSNINDIKLLSDLCDEKLSVDYIVERLFQEVDESNYKFFELIRDMIICDKFVIKVCLLSNGGLHHEKIYVFKFNDEIGLAATGSLNFTYKAIMCNNENLVLHDQIYKYIDQLETFDMLWNNSKMGTNLQNIKDLVVNDLKIEIDKYDNVSTVDQSISKLRQYQHDAIDAVVNNGYCGILKMATGTGKTYTAMGIINKFLSIDKLDKLVIIVVPYQHLAHQWEDEIKGFFGDEIMTQIIHSGISKVDKKLGDMLSYTTKKRCLIFVDDSFINKWKPDVLNKELKHLLIVDELHNLTSDNIQKVLNNFKFKYRIGLSATPEDEFDEKRTNIVFDYFKGIVYEFSLKRAIDEGFLTKYNYYPKKVELESNEIVKFDNLVEKLKINKNDIESQQKLVELLSNAQRKTVQFEADFNAVFKNDKPFHTIVYCSPGKSKTGELTNLKTASNIIANSNNSLVLHKITAEESPETRMKYIKDFQGKNINVLFAIKCLDEGFNIPSIKTAFILNSTIREREYIQRRGRLLRKFEGKDQSYIYDYIMHRDGEIIETEKKRLLSYSELAINIEDIKKEFTL